MKKFLFHVFAIFVISLLFEYGLNAQGERPAQRLNIYVINFYSLPTLLQPGDFDSNHTRVNSIFKIEIKERSLIHEFQKTMTPDQSWQRRISRDQFTSRVVFDFIENERTILSVSFDEYGDMAINDDFDRIFSRKSDMMDAVERSFPIFIDFMR